MLKYYCLSAASPAAASLRSRKKIFTSLKSKFLFSTRPGIYTFPSFRKEIYITAKLSLNRNNSNVMCQHNYLPALIQSKQEATDIFSVFVKKTDNFIALIEFQFGALAANRLQFIQSGHTCLRSTSFQHICTPSSNKQTFFRLSFEMIFGKWGPVANFMECSVTTLEHVISYFIHSHAYVTH